MLTNKTLKKYANTQMTMEELLSNFKNYTVYGMCDNCDIYIVDKHNRAILLFESIGYEDEECLPTLYEMSQEFFEQDFDEIANIYLDDCCKILRLNRGAIPMLKKIQLFPKIRKFYKIFGSEIGSNFIIKLSDITKDNLSDVLFDINEILKANSTCFCEEAYELDIWLNKLNAKISEVM